MRQYTQVDCDEIAQENQRLSITYMSKILSGMGGECELIIGFKDLVTNKIIHIPYKSKIEIAGKKYRILRGKPFNQGPGYGIANSPKCLLDENNNLHYMHKFRHEMIRIIEIHRFLPVKLARLLFNKSKSVNSIERLAA